MLVVVDNFDNGVWKYLTYYIENDTWSTQPLPIRHDPALSLLKIYDGMKTIDTIMNFANIKMGPFYRQLGDESIFILSTAQNNSHYYDWVRLMGCGRDDGTFQLTHEIHYFGGLLEKWFWPMDKPVDTALVYINYPNEDPTSGPLEADVAMLQDNANYQFTIPLMLIKEVFALVFKLELLKEFGL